MDLNKALKQARQDIPIVTDFALILRYLVSNLDSCLLGRFCITHGSMTG